MFGFRVQAGKLNTSRQAARVGGWSNVLSIALPPNPWTV